MILFAFVVGVLLGIVGLFAYFVVDAYANERRRRRRPR